MRGKVFIAWSGTKELAAKVAQALIKRSYRVIVGGDGQENIPTRSEDFFVGATVLGQINQCYQSIYLVQKKPNGTISGNLMFELGYSLGRISPGRIHVFYIDIEQGDRTIPSDLQDIWAGFYSSSDPELVEKIVGKFLENQRIIIPENKFSVMDSYFAQREMIRNYPRNPVCSKYELAQYVLFFSQAAFLFDDVEQGSRTLRGLAHALREEDAGSELRDAIRFGLTYLEIFKCWENENDQLFLRKKHYDKIYWELERIRQNIELLHKKNNDDFTHWFLALLNQTHNYAMVLCSFSPEESPEKQIATIEASRKYANKCLSHCKELVRDDRNKQTVNLYQAYMHRNLATMHQRSGNLTEHKKMLEKSFGERDLLHAHCELADINSCLRDYFEREYYLAMAELVDSQRGKLKTAGGKEKERLAAYLADCHRYVEKIQRSNQERNYYACKIIAHVKAADSMLAEDNP